MHRASSPRIHKVKVLGGDVCKILCKYKILHTSPPKPTLVAVEAQRRKQCHKRDLLQITYFVLHSTIAYINKKSQLQKRLESAAYVMCNKLKLGFYHSTIKM